MSDPGPRITITLDDGFVQIWLNEAGRRAMIRELEGLSERNDHFHLGPFEDAEVRLSSRPYEAGQTVIEYGKVLFRPDEWDRQYYPHVLSEADSGDT